MSSKYFKNSLKENPLNKRKTKVGRGINLTPETSFGIVNRSTRKRIQKENQKTYSKRKNKKL